MGNGPETDSKPDTKEEVKNEKKVKDVKPVETPADKASETPKDKASETSEDKAPETAADKPSDASKETPMETSTATPKETPADKPTEPKNEEKQEPTPELLQKIKNQIEYYFGNVNMQRDKFLIEQTKLDEGWVPMTVMLNFKLLAAMSKDVEVILKALESSDLMEISEDRKKIRRSLKHPLPVFDEEYRKAQEARTVYVKGFPLKDTTIEKLKTFFGDYEPHENIILRKYQDKDKKFQFKGSIFIQFKTLDDAKGFMARESVKYEDTDLIRKWSVDYTVEKAKEKEERRQKKSQDKVKKSENVKNVEGEDEEEENEKDNGLPKGSVLYLADMPATATREDIKESLGALQANIAYVDFKKGDTGAWVRLQGENAAQPVLDQAKDNKVTIKNSQVSCRILEGEEEAKYLTKAKEEMTNSRQKHNKTKKGKKGRGMQRNMRKRRNSSTQDSTPAKKAAAE